VIVYDVDVELVLPAMRHGLYVSAFCPVCASGIWASRKNNLCGTQSLECGKNMLDSEHIIWRFFNDGKFSLRGILIGFP
jgi:hypothetical protein